MRLKSDAKGSDSGLPLEAILVLIIISLSLIVYIPGSSAQGSPSDLIVGAGEETVIYDTSYGLKGSLWIRDGGTLHILNSTFTIYQDYSRQFDVYVSGGARLVLEESALQSQRPLDIFMEDNSELVLKGSELNVPGKLSGYPYSVHMERSDVSLDNLNFAAGSMYVNKSIIGSSSAVISALEGEFVDTIFNADVVFHGDGDMLFRGSAAKDVSVRDSVTVEVHRKLNIDVVDKGGVPVGGASVEIRLYDTGLTVLDTNTDHTGSWSGFVHTETLTQDLSHYVGNLDIIINYQENTISKHVSLPPLGNENMEFGDIVRGTSLTLEFSTVVAPSSYYGSSVTDLVLENTDKMTVRSYPNEGIPNYIAQGNIILSGTSSLIVDRDSSLKVLQGDSNYRIELNDEATLILEEGSSIISDKELNLYLYDSSSLVFRGGMANLNMIHSYDVSTVDLVNASVDVDFSSFYGTELFLTDSYVTGERMEVHTGLTEIEGTDIQTSDEVEIYSSDLTIASSSFNKGLTLGDAPYVELIDVEVPRLSAQPGTIIERLWTLDLRILNTDDKFVPESTVRIFRVNGTHEDLIWEEFVPDGKLNITLLSEVVSTTGTQFKGNYVVRGEKTINADTAYSEETSFALESATQATLKYWQKFPYNLVLDLEVEKTDVDMNEEFQIHGIVYYDITGLEVNSADVYVTVCETQNLTWHVLTDSQGQFSVNVSAPVRAGRYTVTVEAYERNMQMTSKEEFELVVGDTHERQGIREFMFESTIGIAITIFLIMVLVAIAYAIIFMPIGKSTTIGESSSSSEMVKWAEDVLDKKVN
ncbi:MAG: carboxypeptidase-like regulatory domain-containing protein [Thermoplasmata archaeon]